MSRGRGPAAGLGAKVAEVATLRLEWRRSLENSSTKEKRVAGREISPQKAAASVVARLRCFADPVRAAGARRYFKHTIETFGATAPQVRGVVADLYASVRGRWSFDDALALCDILVREAELESKAVGTLILSRFKKEFPRSLFGKIKGWLASDLLANWASVDTLCTDAMGAFLEKYPEYVDRIKRWAGHSNRWVKRASAVSFIKLARKPAFKASHLLSDVMVAMYDGKNHGRNTRRIYRKA